MLNVAILVATFNNSSRKAAYMWYQNLLRLDMLHGYFSKVFHPVLYEYMLMPFLTCIKLAASPRSIEEHCEYVMILRGWKYQIQKW